MTTKQATIHVKRIYQEAKKVDGCRILVDRLWARGLSKDKAKVDVWVKDIAPSTALRQWYGHDPKKWPTFKKKYIAELKANPEAVDEVLKHLRQGTVTLLYSSKEEQLNNAVVLKAYIESLTVKTSPSR